MAANLTNKSSSSRISIDASLTSSTISSMSSCLLSGGVPHLWLTWMERRPHRVKVTPDLKLIVLGIPNMPRRDRCWGRDVYTLQQHGDMV